jgi:murein DD-endopeptidase MepM/ murein hydrolase activator NlpD
MGRLVRGPGYTLMVHRDGSLRSRQLRLPLWMVRVGLVILLAGALGALLVVATYGPIVTAAAREPLLVRQVARLTEENRRIAELAAALDEAEARYAQLRGMLGAQIGAPPSQAGGAGAAQVAGERLYVAPPLVARAPSAQGDSAATAGPSVPHVWPLSVPSYRTRGMVASNSRQEAHPGIDLAVPVGSDVRVAGGGVVRQVGEEPSYGLFVMVQHPEGYLTMYGHLSRVLVAQNDMVRAGQVIALSGNSGRSTAPHLHFEIRLGGRSIDPLTLVREGR